MQAEQTFFTKLKHITAAIESAVYTRETIEKIRNDLDDLDVRQVFFSRLESPEWIPALHAAGLLDFRPNEERPARHTLEKMRILGRSRNTYDAWQDRRRRRHAELIASTMAHLRTEIPTINDDLVEAALRAANRFGYESYSSAIREAATHDSLRDRYDKPAALCARLAEGGESQASLNLARVLFSINPRSGQPFPVKRHDVFWYVKGLSAVAASLTGSHADEVCGLLCEWLLRQFYGAKVRGRHSRTVTLTYGGQQLRKVAAEPRRGFRERASNNGARLI